MPHPDPSRIKTGFYGWWIVSTAVITFGISVGIPYYNLPFLYDYFGKTHGWELKQITLGFPLAALLTIWVGPLLIPRFSPRKLVIVGTGFTALAFFGFGAMSGSLYTYFALYFLSRWDTSFRDLFLTRYSCRNGSRKSAAARWES